MTKKETSKKQPFCLENMPILKNKKGARFSSHRPQNFFKSHTKVAEALLQSLEDNDAGAFLEILDAYLQVNRTQISQETLLSRTTVQKALSKTGNPTIKTIAKIVHHAVA
jgi:probable addiction module antidote protein